MKSIHCEAADDHQLSLVCSAVQLFGFVPCTHTYTHTHTHTQSIVI